jgi:A/G-specific adenine glycosylase
VGRYTAGAIASIAYGEAVPVLDGNVVRVLSRVFNVTEPTDTTATRERLWSLAAALVPRNVPGDFNQGLMELGARICMPKAPDCQACPIRRFCQARALGVQEQRPARKLKKAAPHYEIVAAAIARNGRYLIGKRPPHGLLGGLWEFPGGKVKPGETHRKALEREVREELGVRVKVGGLIASVNHAYSHFRVTLHVYQCALAGVGAPRPNTHTKLKWVFPSHFARYAFPKANHKFLGLL